MSWWREARRRNVVRVGMAYAAVAWVLAQLAQMLFDTFGAPEWVSKVFIALLVLLFPLALLFAWAFELTPEGIKRTDDVDPDASITHKTGRKLNYMITAALAVAVVVLLAERFIAPSPPESAASAGAAGDASIAVLPFADMSPDADQEYFADGISEELLNLLARLEGMKVAARTSSFAFKGRNEDIKEIAATLGVANVLEGSVRKAGTKLRITAQLIDADTGYHLWSDTYDRKLDDVFAIQDEIATAIVAALEQHLGFTASAPKVARSDNVDGYSAYLEGRFLMEKRTRAALEQAVAAFDTTIRLDPDYAPAYAATAEATLLLVDSPSTYGDLSRSEAIALADPLVTRALQLAPDSAEAHAAHGLLLGEKEQHAAALAAYDRALAINPNLVRAHFWRANALHVLGRYAEQLQSQRRAVALDPLSFVAVSNLAAEMTHRGNADEALRMVEKLVRVRDDQRALHAMVSLHRELGQFDEAHRWVLEAIERSPGDGALDFSRISIYTGLGLHERAAEVADPGWERAWVAFQRGDHQDAITEIEQVIAAVHVEILIRVAAFMHVQVGDGEAALATLEPLMPGEGGRQGALYSSWKWPAALVLARAQMLVGDDEGAAQTIVSLQNFMDETRATGIDSPALDYAEAQVFALAGERDRALQRLRSVIDHRYQVALDLSANSVFASLHGDPEFERLMDEYRRERERQRENVLEQLGLTASGRGVAM